MLRFYSRSENSPPENPINRKIIQMKKTFLIMLSILSIVGCKDYSAEYYQNIMNYSKNGELSVILESSYSEFLLRDTLGNIIHLKSDGSWIWNTDVKSDTIFLAKKPK
jgi:hypothetical protein